MTTFDVSRINNKRLDAIAIDSQEIAKLSSNIGDIGIAPDFSNNSLRNPLQNQYPLLTWLLNTAMSTMMRNASRQGLAPIHKDSTTGDWVIMAPYSVYTLPPTDTAGECCWAPLDIAKCGNQAPLSLLCLKDCTDILDGFINQNRRAGSNDLTGYFQRPGESVTDARNRMNRESMAFFTAYNVINGVTTAGTAVLKPFHGLLEVMENPAVIKILGTNILAAMDALWCRLSVLDGGNYVIAVHPLVLMAIEAAVQPGKFGQLPAGWTRDGGTLRFNGVGFIADKVMPVDLTAGTGEAWLIDGDTTGAFLGTDLRPTEMFIRNSFTHGNVPAEGCAEECTYYYNYGAVMNNNTNHLAVITDIPLSSNCLGTALQGLDGLINPNTLVPVS